MTKKTIEERGDGRAVQLKGVRLSFTQGLYEKKATVKDGVPKHNFNVILETAHPNFAQNKAKIEAALAAAAEREWKDGNRWKRIAENDPKRLCFRKGERFANQESGEPYNGYAGNFGIAVGCPGKGQKRPGKLLDRHKRTVEEKDILDVFYSGTYADVVIEFYGTNEGGPGIFCTASAIRSHQQGENLGGGGVPVDDDDFDDLEDEEDSFGDAPTTGSASSSDDFLV